MCTFIWPHKSRLNSAFEIPTSALVGKKYFPLPGSWGAASYFHRAWPEYSLPLTWLLAHFRDHDIFQVPIQHSSPSDTAFCSSPWEAPCLHVRFMDGPNSFSQSSPMYSSLKQLELLNSGMKQKPCHTFQICCRLFPQPHRPTHSSSRVSGIA